MDKNRGDYFKTEGAFYSWMRSQLRKIWNVHPTKLDFLKSVRFMKVVGNRKLFHCKCYLCLKDFQLKFIEVDHLHPAGNIKEGGYADKLLDIDIKDLATVCKPCHDIKTYSERHGISFDDAVIEKKVIAFSKLSIEKQKEILGEFFSKARNAKDRRAEFRATIR